MAFQLPDIFSQAPLPLLFGFIVGYLFYHISGPIIENGYVSNLMCQSDTVLIIALLLLHLALQPFAHKIISQGFYI